MLESTGKSLQTMNNNQTPEVRANQPPSWDWTGTGLGLDRDWGWVEQYVKILDYEWKSLRLIFYFPKKMLQNFWAGHNPHPPNKNAQI